MADTKISAMTSASDLTGAVMPVVQGGVNKKFDASQLALAASTVAGTLSDPAGTIIGSSQLSPVAGKVIYYDANKSLANGPNKAAVELVPVVFPVGVASGAVATGVWHQFQVPWACTITKWTVTAEQSGSIQFDIWKDTDANFPPTNVDTITASAKPLLSLARKNSSSTLTGWTTSVAAGDWLFINVDSATTVTLAWLELELTLT